MANKHRDPTPEEIEEECRKIREEGHWERLANGERVWRKPWTKDRLAKQAGLTDAPYTVPEVSLAELGVIAPCKGHSLASTLPDWVPDDGWIEMRKRQEKRRKKKARKAKR